MRRLHLCLAAALAVLSACKDPEPPGPRSYPLTVVFVAPYDGQPDVPTSTRVWIRASEALSDEKVRSTIRLATDTGEVADFSATLSEDHQAVVLAPTQPLQAGRSYQVLFRRDPGSSEEVVSTFVTRSTRAHAQDGFQVRWFLPMDAPALSVWPFTTLRVVFSEPVNPDTIGRGVPPSIGLVRVSTGELVAAEVLVRGTTVTLDPSADLEAGERYRLELTGGILDLTGELLTPTSMEVVVQPLAPMRQLSLALGPTPAGDGGTPPGSRLETKPPNTLELRSTLVGLNTLSLEGALDAELPDPGQHGAHLPMVIRKGQILTVRGPDNGGLAIRLGGVIGTTLNSGPLSMTLLTDASGEISENPWQPDAPGARPLVRLSMDAALTAQDPTVSTMLTQDLLGLQLVGSLYVQEGRLGVELVGGVELDLLGLETGASSVTIGAWSAEKAPAPAVPPMSLRIIAPADNDEGVELDRPLQVVFSQPPDSSARAGVWLERAPGDGVRGSADDVSTALVTDGAMVLLRPRAPLDVGAQYVVRVAPGIRSITGASLESSSSATFRTREINPLMFKPTAVASTQPGAPCAFLSGGSRQCSPESPVFAPFALAGDLPVEAHFTKPVDRASLVLGQTVEVRELDGGTRVPGRLIAGSDWLQFIPNEPWRAGHPYVVRLGGAPDGGAGDGGCGQAAICDLMGRVVNTDLLLDDNGETEGGPPIQLPFAGAPPGHGGLMLRLAPATDTNSNGLLDLSVPLEVPRPENSVTMRDPEDGGSVVDRTYLSGALLAEVGRFDPGTNELPLTLDVGSWLYGTSCNIFGITSDRLVIHPASRQSGAVRAPPLSDPDQRPIMTLPMSMFMHSVDQTVEQSLQRTPLQMTLEGRLGFTPDGRMEAAMSNTNTAHLSLLQGRVVILIAPGDVRVKARSGVLGR
ncbi:MAG TPA: Ig-like domain-containing protein [Myxococcales bacterium]|nr:Ig-like domain-containing protein [Myxococcales bacterium]